MSREIDARIQRFTEVLERLPGGEARAERFAARADRYAMRTRRLKRTLSNGGIRVRRAMIAVGLLIAALIGYALFVGPLGLTVFALAILLMPILATVVGSFNYGLDVGVPQLKKAAPAVLPAQADRWLDSRRAELPRLAAPTLDRISAQLNVIGPQLAAVPELNPLAQDVSRLLNKHLPELVERYIKVPAGLRTQPDSDGGPSIEKRLVEGLKTVEGELARVSESLSRDDKDAFLVKNQFLEDRYKADSGVK